LGCAHPQGSHFGEFDSGGQRDWWTAPESDRKVEKWWWLLFDPMLASHRVLEGVGLSGC
jgi:hypothetical protein